MDGIKINTGVIRLEVNCDGVKDETSFNPNYVVFMENIYRLMGELQNKKARYAEAEERLNENKGIDENGVPLNMQERMAFMELPEDCIMSKIIYFRTQFAKGKLTKEEKQVYYENGSMFELPVKLTVEEEAAEAEFMALLRNKS